jgi:hypothetical protein
VFSSQRLSQLGGKRQRELGHAQRYFYHATPLSLMEGAITGSFLPSPSFPNFAMDVAQKPVFYFNSSGE